MFSGRASPLLLNFTSFLATASSHRPVPNRWLLRHLHYITHCMILRPESVIGKLQKAAVVMEPGEGGADAPVPSYSCEVAKQRTRPAASPLMDIPMELKLRIASYLDIGDLGCLRATCKHLDRSLYDHFVDRFAEIPRFSEWLSHPHGRLRMIWTEDGLGWAVFVLQNKSIAAHVRELLIINTGFFNYPSSGQYLDNKDLMQRPEKAAFSVQREHLGKMEPRHRELLETIWKATNARFVGLKTNYELPDWLLTMHTEPKHRLHVPSGYVSSHDQYESGWVHEESNSEQAKLVSARIMQASSVLLSVIEKDIKSVDTLRISGGESVMKTSVCQELSVEALEHALAKFSSNLGSSLACLRVLALSLDSVDFTFSYKSLRSADRPCSNISYFFGNLAQLEELEFGSSLYNTIPPTVVDSALSALPSKRLARIHLNSVIIRKETVSRLLRYFSNSLKRLNLYNISLLDGTWEPLLKKISQETTMILGSYRLTELCTNGIYMAFFMDDSGFDILKPGWPMRSSVRVSKSFRFEWGADGDPDCKSKWARNLEQMIVSRAAILWAGVHFAAQHDRILSDTREIRTWD
ncbi:uncharacterized protein BKA78DRAFT_76626 [Phyllosticta capitalensis]|uniref:uncharacterized protein n=1 Tax=Phyllosticta capitalensis TaxID=121624 RepID=UPI00312E0FD0